MVNKRVCRGGFHDDHFCSLFPVPCSLFPVPYLNFKKRNIIASALQEYFTFFCSDLG